METFDSLRLLLVSLLEAGGDITFRFIGGGGGGGGLLGLLIVVRRELLFVDSLCEGSLGGGGGGFRDAPDGGLGGGGGGLTIVCEIVIFSEYCSFKCGVVASFW